MGENIEFRRFSDSDAMSAAATGEITSLAQDVLVRQDRFSLVLSGGSTPKPLHRKLAESPGFPWERTHIFWGDERCLPPDTDGSNYKMAKETLLDHIDIPAENIHRMPGELPPDKGAEVYEESLELYFGDAKPAFDCVVLGMGNDGHTASLFPGEQALEERERFVAVVRAETASPPVPRLTLTLPVLNVAGMALFLVGGEGKQAIIDSIELDQEAAAKRYPAARISDPRRVVWFINTSMNNRVGKLK